MRRRTTLIFLLVLLTLCAVKTQRKDEKISELFMRINPALSRTDAQAYARIVIDASEKFKQNPYVIAAIIVHESTVNRKAISKGGDYGLMQVRWKVHEKAIKSRFPKVRKAKDILEAKPNVFFGTEIFSDCMRKANGDVGRGLMLYSGGSTKLRDKVLATVRELERKG